MITTAASQFELRIWLKVSSPLIPGNHTSSRTQPYARCSIAFKHSSPEATASALKPSSRSTALNVSRIPRSSSTIRIDSDIAGKVFDLWSWVFGLWPLVFGLWSLVFGLLFLTKTEDQRSKTTYRQLNHKPGSARSVRLGIDAAAMLVNDPGHDCQAQPRAPSSR